MGIHICTQHYGCRMHDVCICEYDILLCMHVCMQYVCVLVRRFHTVSSDGGGRYEGVVQVEE